MADPKALQVIKTLQAGLEQIQTANGFATDAGLRISRGRKKFASNETFPLLFIHEGEESVSKRMGITNHLEMPVSIEGFIEADINNPLDDGHKLLADIKKSLSPALSQNRRLIFNWEYQGRVINPPDDGSRYTNVTVQVVLHWAEELTNPY